MFVGVSVAHNRTAASTASNTSSTTLTADSPTLAQATAQAQTVYDAYIKQVLDGQVLQDKSQWATANVSTAEDLQFINAHKSYFTGKFVAVSNKYKTTNTVPRSGMLLLCESSVAEFNSDLKINGDKLNGSSATVTASYSMGRTPSTFNVPVTLKASGAAWLVDSINCGN